MGSTHIPLQARLMHDLINVIRRHARPRRRRRNIQHLPRQTTHRPHPLNLLLIQNGDVPAPAQQVLLGARDAIFRVVRVLNLGGHLSPRRQRVDRAEGPCVGEGREGVVVAGCVWFRNDFGGEEGAERVTALSRLVLFLVFTLCVAWISMKQILYALCIWRG